MTKYLDRLPLQPRLSSSNSLFWYLVVLILGFFFGQFVGTLVIIPFIGVALEALTRFAEDPGSIPNGQQISWLMQSIYTVVSYILIPLAFVKYYERQQVRVISPEWKASPVDFILPLAIIFPFLIVNAQLIQWNQGLDLSFLGALGEWAVATEKQMAEQTEFMTQMDGLGDAILLTIMIAVLPAIGEEIAFRGLLQNYIHRASGNAHIAVWGAAIVFSAIHMQFLGFFPRMALGVLFGYLFIWSGRLWVAMLAHFLNNFITVLLVYSQQHGMIEDVTESPELMPLLPTLIAVGAVAGLGYYYWNYYRQREALV
ncbi:MAG: CPBP family intramembrane glutamic endopeptidase [Bacteroidota bacterium]